MSRMILLSLFVFTIINSYGEFPILNHQIESINFNNPEGTGTINGVSFDIVLEQDKLIFTPLITDAEEIVWDNMPSLLSELDQFTIESAQVSSLPNKLKLTLESLIGNSSQSDLLIENVMFSCINSQVYEDPYEEMIDSCTSNANLEWEKFQSNISANQATGTSALKLAQAASNLFQSNKAFNEINISDVKLKIEDNRLGGYFRMPVNGRVRKIDVKGDVEYDGQKRVVKIHFDWIKYFFVTITDDFFKELEQLESATFVVDSPNIYIYLD